jgi:hypothetical protein
MRVAGISTTHEELPGVSLTIPDFRDPALESWLATQGVAETAGGNG